MDFKEYAIKKIKESEEVSKLLGVNETDLKWKKEREIKSLFFYFSLSNLLKFWNYLKENANKS